VAPVAECKSGWQWNGRICEVVAPICPKGFQKNHEGKCDETNYACPSGFERVSKTNSCRRSPFECPSGFVKKSNVCSRTVEKCPDGSEWQYGKCGIIKLVCPPDSQMTGEICMMEEIINMTHYEM
jgi:hypothetical protein